MATSNLAAVTPGMGSNPSGGSTNGQLSAQARFNASVRGPGNVITAPSAAAAPGAGAVNVAPAGSALATDPAYLAYMRALGISNANDTAAAQRQTDALNASLAVRVPEIQQSDQVAAQNNLGRLEARGILESGPGANAMAQLANTQAYTLQGDISSNAARVAAIQQRLQSSLLGNQVKGTEQALAAEGKVGLSMGETQVAQAANNAAAAVGNAPGAAPGVA